MTERKVDERAAAAFLVRELGFDVETLSDGGTGELTPEETARFERELQARTFATPMLAGFWREQRTAAWKGRSSLLALARNAVELALFEQPTTPGQRPHVKMSGARLRLVVRVDRAEQLQPATPRQDEPPSKSPRASRVSHNAPRGALKPFRRELRACLQDLRDSVERVLEERKPDRKKHPVTKCVVYLVFVIGGVPVVNAAFGEPTNDKVTSREYLKSAARALDKLLRDRSGA